MNFPDEILLKIFEYLSVNTLAITAQVSKKWNDFSKDNSVWEKRISVRSNQSIQSTDYYFLNYKSFPQIRKTEELYICDSLYCIGTPISLDVKYHHSRVKGKYRLEELPLFFNTHENNQVTSYKKPSFEDIYNSFNLLLTMRLFFTYPMVEKYRNFIELSNKNSGSCIWPIFEIKPLTILKVRHETINFFINEDYFEFQSISIENCKDKFKPISYYLKNKSSYPYEKQEPENISTTSNATANSSCIIS